MVKMLRRWLRSLVALMLISLVSVGIGLAHFLYKGGSLGEVKTQIAAGWERAGKALSRELPDRGNEWVQKGEQAAQQAVKRVADQVREATGATPSPAPTSTPPAAVDKNDSPAADAPAAPPPSLDDSPASDIAPPPLPEGIHVYFAPCEANQPESLEQAFLGMLRNAHRSIIGAFYDLQLTSVADALIAKHKEGIAVRLVSDSNYKDRDAIQACQKAGIPVVFDERQPFMHNKFCVVDDEVVWTGSTNITENCFYRNNNNSLRLESPQLAADYTAEFDEMFQQRLFGKAGKAPTPYPQVTIGDVSVECYFAPDDQVQKHVVSTVNEAKTSIDFLAFAFTAKPIAEAMAARAKSGVRVRGVFEERNANAAPSQDEYLARAGATIRMDTNPATMHDKVIIVDGTTVVTGSYNFSKAADTDNDENLLIVHSPVIAKTYTAEFEKIMGK